MKLLVENRYALFGLVLVALFALFGVATALGAVGAGAGGGVAEERVVAEVESATRVCPAPRGEDRESELAGFSLGGRQDIGSQVVKENEKDVDSMVEGGETGRPWSEDTTGAGRHTVVRAEGAYAAGLETTQTTIGEDSPHATEVRCSEPSLSSWFAAPGGAALQGTQLLLANVDDEPATVSVDVYASDGPVLSDELRGITVEPHDETELSLTGLTEGAETVAVNVRSNKGRVASSLFAERTDVGHDWVPVTLAPDEHHVIPGVPDGGGERRLIVAAPGEKPATVNARVFTPDGGGGHQDLGGLIVPPEASETVNLEDTLQERPGTVVVQADQPVVVGVAMERDDGDDTSYVPAAQPLEGPLRGTAVAPAVPEGADSRLAFGAPERAAGVVVTPVEEDGTQGDSQKVEIEAGRTEVPELESPEGAHALIVQVPDGSPPVYGARELTWESDGDQATATIPLRPSPSEVALPAVSDSLTSTVP